MMGARSLPPRLLGTFIGGVCAGGLLVSGVLQGAPAAAYWTDSGEITAQLTAWSLTNVDCAAAFGSDHVLTWSQPSGTSEVSLTVEDRGLLSTLLTIGGWTSTSTVTPDRDDVDGSPATWGFSGALIPLGTRLTGTWTLLASSPGIPGWQVQRSGTWYMQWAGPPILGPAASAGCDGDDS